METPPKSPPPAPAAAVRARRFNGTVATLWLPITACASRTGRLRAAGLRAPFLFGAAFFLLSFAFAVVFFAPRLGFFCFAFFAMLVASRRPHSLSLPAVSVIDWAVACLGLRAN